MFLGACTQLPKAPPMLVLETDIIRRTTVAFSADVSLLASGGVDGKLTLWSLPEGKQVRAWRAHAESVHALAFVSGERLVSASYDKTLAVWNSDGTLHQRRVTPAPIGDMSVYEAADMIVTGHGDGVVRRWRLTDLRLESEIALHRGGIYAVSHHPSGMYASSGHDGAVYVWRANDVPRALEAPPTDARDLVFSRDGRFLYGGGWFKVFRWRIADGALTVVPTEHHGIIGSLDISADGRRLASISRETDSAVQLLDAATGAVYARLQSHELCGRHVRLSPDGRYLATTSDDASVRVWDLTQTTPRP